MDEEEKYHKLYFSDWEVNISTERLTQSKLVDIYNIRKVIIVFFISITYQILFLEYINFYDKLYELVNIILKDGKKSLRFQDANVFPCLACPRDKKEKNLKFGSSNRM